MTLGRIACVLAVVAVICVLAVFFFPAMQGPYSAVHGPVTALLSARAAGNLRATITHAALNALHVWLTSALFLTFWTAVVLIKEQSACPLAESSSILRC
jgi:hypothetical protein